MRELVDCLNPSAVALLSSRLPLQNFWEVIVIMGMPRVVCVMVLVAGSLSLAACSVDRSITTNEIDPSGHLYREDYLDLRERGSSLPATDETAFPPIPSATLALKPPPPPAPAGSDHRVSVTITDNMPLRDVLIELARESKVNLELDPRIQGGIIFTAHSQPFDTVLKRICALAGLRTSADGNFIRIELDDPYQQTYPLDFSALRAVPPAKRQLPPMCSMSTLPMAPVAAAIPATGPVFRKTIRHPA